MCYLYVGCMHERITLHKNERCKGGEGGQEARVEAGAEVDEKQ